MRRSKKIPLLALAVLLLALSYTRVCAQATSSKGTEFWTAFMDHSAAAGTNGSQMILYITSDKATTGTVSFTDGTASIPYTVTANTVTFVTIPASQFLSTEGQFKKGIHITSVLPVAVYAHIYASSVSGATLLIPVNTMGKDYYSLNYTQLSNTNPSYSDFAVIATEDNTTVEITPTATLLSGKVTGTPFQVTLNKGEVYQGLSLTDLTGTHIRSISTTTGTCKKIAVFSGSSKIGIGTYNSALGTNSQMLSSDNLFQQVYPTATWGKNFITVSLKSRNYDIYRIVLSKSATNVTLNGVLIPASSFTNGLYYEFTTTGVATNVISADQPIQVVQYTPTQSQALPHPKTITDIGDPEMIFLSPIEQGLDHVTLYSTGYFAIQNAFINVVIPTSAASTFTIDGASGTVFTPISGTNYSFAQITTTHGPNAPNANPSYGGTATSGTHNLNASQPFNAIAYGFGMAESYGYAAGTNLVNLNEFVTLQNTQSGSGGAALTSGCTNVPYTLQVNIPYQTTKITWDLKDGSTPVVDNNPKVINTTVKNNQTIYTYQYSGTVNYTKASDNMVVATVFNPFGDDCGSDAQIEFNFSITDVPTAAFSTPLYTCLGGANVFTDKSDPKTSTIRSWYWDFGDGTTAITQNPTYTYGGAGDYAVTLTVTNENGCNTTSAVQTVHVSALPQSGFTYSKPDCATQAVTFTDASTTPEGVIASWAWNFGDGTPTVAKTDNSAITHNFATAGTYTVTLTVTTQGGCIGIPYNINVVVDPSPVVDFTLPTICLQNAIAQFTNNTTISGTTGNPLKYVWNFGDVNATTANPNIVTTTNPTHQFTAAGVYHVSLTVTSNDGCAVTTIKDYTVSGIAKFTAPSVACPADLVNFTDQTDATKTVATAWHWDFNDGSTADVQNPQHAFATPGDYMVTLTVTGNNGCSTTTYSQPIHITASPVASYKYSSPDCETRGVTFTDLSTSAESPIASWIWDFGDGTALQTNSTNTAFTHIFTTAGNYTVRLQVVTVSGCASSPVAQTVVINPLPIVDFSLPDACLNDKPQFNDKSTIADGSQGSFTYLWNFGDPNANAGNPNTSTLANPAHFFTEPRDDSNPYIITLTVTSKNGCTVTTTHNFTVNGANPVAAFAKDPSNTYCSSDDVLFINQATVGFGKVTLIKMYWDYNGDQSNFTLYQKDEINSAAFKLSHNYGLFNNPNQTKTYAVKMFAYSGSSTSCSGESAIQTITIKPNPLITLSALGSICQEASPVQIIENKNGFTGTGVFSGTGISPTGMFDPAKSGPGTFSINYFFTAANSCGFSTSQQVIVNPTPKVNAGSNLILLEGGNITINATASGNAPLTYKWTLANGNKAVGLDHDDILSPTASPANNTTYMLTVTSADGCTASSNVSIAVLKAPIVPNVFTPNNDGINDQWNIQYLDTYPNASVEVFNRNGTKLYTSAGYPIPWDGTYNGSLLPVGTYYYIINPKNGRKIIAGSVTIIR